MGKRKSTSSAANAQSFSITKGEGSEIVISTTDLLSTTSKRLQFDPDYANNQKDSEVLAALKEGKESDEDHFENGSEIAASKYEVRQRVIARDEDGLMYFANIRRKIYGINHQKSVSCLHIVGSFPESRGQQTLGESPGIQIRNAGDRVVKVGNGHSDNEDEPVWFYFVHFEGWKSLWDRWVSESDIMEPTARNEQKMKETMQANRSLQKEVKEKSKKRKIQNPGLFTKLWKQRLDWLTEKWKTEDTKESDPSRTENLVTAAASKKKTLERIRQTEPKVDLIEEQSFLAAESCLTNRRQAHIQAIAMAFGLKRIMVEDWEIINASTRNNSNLSNASHSVDESMVHDLPAQVTIRIALSLYLKDKGIEWNGISKIVDTSKVERLSKRGTKKEALPEPDKTMKIDQSHSSPVINTEDSNTVVDTTSCNTSDGIQKNHGFDSISDCEQAKISPSTTDEVKAKTVAKMHQDVVPDQLAKEWTDMADGIALYFEQSLTTRLLYPSEVSQLIVMEESLAEELSLDKVDIYGCEHLLRLIAIMPRVLDQQYQDIKLKRMDAKGVGTCSENEKKEVDDGFAEMGNIVLAKLQDLARFLQKKQSTLFCARYRKKNEEEMKQDRRAQKQLERRLKNKAALLLPRNSSTDIDVTDVPHLEKADGRKSK